MEHYILKLCKQYMVLQKYTNKNIKKTLKIAGVFTICQKGLPYALSSNFMGSGISLAKYKAIRSKKHCLKFDLYC